MIRKNQGCIVVFGICSVIIVFLNMKTRDYTSGDPSTRDINGITTNADISSELPQHGVSTNNEKLLQLQEDLKPANLCYGTGIKPLPRRPKRPGYNVFRLGKLIFLPDYKNPCYWDIQNVRVGQQRVRRPHLRCLPYFTIIGMT